MDTHHNAHILTLAPSDDGYLVTLSRNGETSPAVTCPGKAGLHRAIHSTAIDSFDAGAPLLVVVATVRNRANPAEVQTKDFATACVLAVLNTLPRTLPGQVGGKCVENTNEVFTPRVTTLPLPWAAGQSELGPRVFDFACALAHDDTLLPFIPEATTFLTGTLSE